MPDKQKVTLYLPPRLHRQLKIRAAVDTDSMSAMVERAVHFYLKYPEVVAETEATSHGETYQVHTCPSCDSSLINRDGEMVLLENQPGILAEDVPLGKMEEVREMLESRTDSQGEEELVPC